MARPRKEGLDYFPLDTEFNPQVEALVAEFGNDGLAVYIRFLQAAYRSADGVVSCPGVFHRKTFAKRAEVDVSRWEAVVSCMVELELLDREAWETRGSMVSNGVRKRLEAIASRRESERNRKLGAGEKGTKGRKKFSGRKTGGKHADNLRSTEDIRRYSGGSLSLSLSSTHEEVRTQIQENGQPSPESAPDEPPADQAAAEAPRIKRRISGTEWVVLSRADVEALLERYERDGLTSSDLKRAIELFDIWLSKSEKNRNSVSDHRACLRGWPLREVKKELADDQPRRVSNKLGRNEEAFRLAKKYEEEERETVEEQA